MPYLKDIKKLSELRNAFTLFWVLIELFFEVPDCLKFLRLRFMAVCFLTTLSTHEMD